MADGGPLRVLVVDGVPLYRTALAAVLAEEPGFEVIAAVGEGRAAVGAVSSASVDVAIISAELPDRPGVDVCAAVRSVNPQVRIVLTASEADDELLCAAIARGVDGFLTKDADLEEVIGCLRRVCRGETVVPPQMLGGLLQALVRRSRQADGRMQLLLRLTPREREVLELLVDGCDHDAVADILVISPQTARTHIQNVIEKLGVHSRVEAAALAAEHGFFGRLAVRG